MENKDNIITDKDIEDSLLFSTCSYLNKEIKIQVLKWYNTLTDEQKGFVDIIKDEQREETIYQKDLDEYFNEDYL